TARSTVTDQTGHFTLLLDRGRHTLTISSAGFTDAVLSVTAPDSGTETREVVLQLAGVREDVSVSAPAGDRARTISTATRTATPLGDVPQSITVVSNELIKDQLMTSVGDVVRYVPGV